MVDMEFFPLRPQSAPVIFDEYHFGAWRENAKKLFELEDEDTSLDFNAEAFEFIFDKEE